MFLLLISLAENIRPVKEVEAGVNVLNRLPVVREVAEMEATEPMVLAEVNSNEPEEMLPGSVSTTLKTPLGVVVLIPILGLSRRKPTEAALPKTVKIGVESIAAE